MSFCQCFHLYVGIMDGTFNILYYYQIATYDESCAYFIDAYKFRFFTCKCMCLLIVVLAQAYYSILEKNIRQHYAIRLLTVQADFVISSFNIRLILSLQIIYTSSRNSNNIICLFKDALLSLKQVQSLRLSIIRNNIRH